MMFGVPEHGIDYPIRDVLQAFSDLGFNVVSSCAGFDYPGHYTTLKDQEFIAWMHQNKLHEFDLSTKGRQKLIKAMGGDKTGYIEFRGIDRDRKFHLAYLIKGTGFYISRSTIVIRGSNDKIMHGWDRLRGNLNSLLLGGVGF